MARKKPRNRSAKAVKPSNRRRRGLLWSVIAVAAVVGGGALLYFSYSYHHPRIESGAGLALSRKEREKQVRLSQEDRERLMSR